MAATAPERTPSSLRSRVRHGLEMYGPPLKPRHVARCALAFGRDRVARRRYRMLSEQELLATRRSDTAVLFGSGGSLREIEDAEWERLAQHDTISFRDFPRQRWIRADYHVTGEVDFLEEYAARLRANPLYRDTVYVVQEGWFAHNGNDLVGRRLLPEGARLFRYRRASRAQFALPSRRFADGLVHGWSSAISVVNFAVVMGWRRIVVAGVDLYNREYFWLPPGERRAYETRGLGAEDRFANHDRIVALFAAWREALEPDGVELLVHNPRSLLAEVLPVYESR